MKKRIFIIVFVFGLYIDSRALIMFNHNISVYDVLIDVNESSIRYEDAININQPNITVNTNNMIKQRSQNIGNKSNNFSLDGITFDYPSSWTTEQETLQQYIAFQVTCSNDSRVDQITIMWLNFDMDLKDLINGIISGMTGTGIGITQNKIKQTNFNGIQALTMEYKMQLLNEEFGLITAFKLNGKTLAIIKQSDEYSKLFSEFKKIENTLKVH